MPRNKRAVTICTINTDNVVSTRSEHYINTELKHVLPFAARTTVSEIRIHVTVHRNRLLIK